MTFYSPQKNNSHIRLFVRIILDTLTLFCVFAGPWWLSLILATILLFYFGAYEAIIVGVFLDSLYIHETAYWLTGEFLFTIVLCILATLASYITPYIRGVDHSTSY